MVKDYLGCLCYQGSYPCTHRGDQGEGREVEDAEGRQGYLGDSYVLKETGHLRQAGKPLVTNCMLIQKLITYLWAEMAMKSSQTDLEIMRMMTIARTLCLTLSVRPMAIPSKNS